MKMNQRPTCVAVLNTEPSSLLVARQISSDCQIPIYEFPNGESVSFGEGDCPLVIFQGFGSRIEGWFSPVTRYEPRKFFPEWAVRATWGIAVNPSHIREGKDTEVEKFATRVRNCARQAAIWFFSPRFENGCDLSGERPIYPWGESPSKKKKKEGAPATRSSRHEVWR